MKRFIWKYLLLVLLVLSTVAVLNFLYTRTNYWKDSVIYGLSKFSEVPEHIQIANVGSSHGQTGFDYNHIPYQGFNFAVSAQFFLYDYMIIKQYIECFDKNAVLLIPISYFQITRIKTDFRDQRVRYYRFLDKQLMDKYSLSEKIMFSIVPVLSAGGNIKFIINDTPPVDLSKCMTTDELTKHCTGRYKYFTGKENDLGKESGAEGFAHNKQWVSKIIELCRAYNIQPVLITTPITSVLNNMYAEKSPDFFDTFYRFTRELQEAYPLVPYFDYSHDSRFENNFSLFYDGDHLNTAGAEQFTAIVISDLQSSGLLPVLSTTYPQE